MGTPNAPPPPAYLGLRLLKLTWNPMKLVGRKGRGKSWTTKQNLVNVKMFMYFAFVCVCMN